MIRTVKVFGIVNKAELDVFLELSCFFDDPADVGNLISAEYTMQNAGLDEAQLESGLPGEISITSDMQMTPPLGQKVKKS